jgi:hypothetical protein
VFTSHPYKGGEKMRKVEMVALCVFLCWVIALVCVPNTVKSKPQLDDTYCLKCHVKADLHTAHGDITCDNCHSTAAGGGTVASSKCLACHPTVDAELCDLVKFHEAFTGNTVFEPVNNQSCASTGCHANCLGETTTTIVASTTTTIAVSTTTTIPSICPSEEIYGENSAEVQILRYVRDNVLSQTPEGQEIIKLYYQLSPVITKAIQNDPGLKTEMKAMIEGVLALQ